MTKCAQYVKIICILLLHCYALATIPNIGQLPHCVDDTNDQGLLLISTLNGKLSAMNSSGALLWDIDTGPGPLLKSNIHNVELTNNGEWIRIIPSLTGSLYKFNGKFVDALPVTADSLLKSSFFYSQDIVIAGGKEVRTYGIGLKSGDVLYECSIHGCQNKTQNEEEIENIIIVERNTLTVRAHEPRTGSERWNFSVGHHNIKIPNYSCISTDAAIMNFNVSAILPEGLVRATKIGNDNQNNILWQHKFDSPIVKIWRWNGRDLVNVDVFDIKTPGNKKNGDLSPAIYLGMHNKQLYIHESINMLNVLQIKNYPQTEVIESKSITRIPWKPVPAAQTAIISKDDDRSTALSVLYNSEYVNGNGYYLYTEHDISKQNTLICEENSTENVSSTSDGNEDMNIWFWWKEILLLSFSTALVLNCLWSYRLLGLGRSPISRVLQEKSITDTKVSDASNETKSTDISEPMFHSRYTNDFETVRCLGKGGFGVVFEAKQKIDECAYAIKRITLPNEDHSRDRVLREVKALATLDHHNIVRYFNSWVECPPNGWHQDHDKNWMQDASTFTYNVESTNTVESRSHRRNNSTIIELSDIVSFRDDNDEIEKKCTSTANMTDNKYSSSSCTSPVCFRKCPVFLYIQMQLCRKESLRDWLFVNNHRKLEVVVPIFQQIIRAVEYVHIKGLIHRDLKPSNIFFSIEGDIKVGDFGLVTAMQDCADDQNNSLNALLGSHTRGAGTQLYMSPEQIQGKKYNYKVDIYSLGVILFELLVPFSTEMERQKTLTDLRKNVYPDNFGDNFPQEFQLLKMMLSQNPNERPTTIGIRARPPLSETYNGANGDYFELPSLN